MTLFKWIARTLYEYFGGKICNEYLCLSFVLEKFAANEIGNKFNSMKIPFLVRMSLIFKTKHSILFIFSIFFIQFSCVLVFFVRCPSSLSSVYFKNRLTFSKNELEWHKECKWTITSDSFTFAYADMDIDIDIHIFLATTFTSLMNKWLPHFVLLIHKRSSSKHFSFLFTLYDSHFNSFVHIFQPRWTIFSCPLSSHTYFNGHIKFNIFVL